MKLLNAIFSAALLVLPATAMAGPYFGAGIGGSRAESSLSDVGLLPGEQDDVDALTSDDFTSTDVGFQVVAGWRFGSYLGVEVGYAHLGNNRQNYELPELCNPFGCQSREWEAQVDIDGLQAFVTGYLPLNDKIEAYAKVGALSWDAEFRGNERRFDLAPLPPLPPGNDPVSFDDDGTDIAAALGLNLKSDSAISVRTEFTWYDIENTDLAWMLSLNAVYNF
jgi:Outer membrane protein beta-barrel domain